MRKRSFFKKAFCFVLATVLVLGSNIIATAATQTYDMGERPYEIAVAYDNSGSMYGATGEWCYAKYAMEIFASMMDLTGRDKLTVFTMHDVKTDGAAKTKRIEVKTVADIDKIHKMSTLAPSGTPFSVVEEAYSYLSSVKENSKKELWLIVLTDGAFDIGNKLQSKLEGMAKGSINVQYIPFGATELKDDNPNDAFHAAKKVLGKDELRETLISVCNKIFQRNELTDRLNGNTLSIDLSMKRIVVFVQGKDASITALKDSNGNPVKVLMDSGKRTYSKYSFGQDKLAMPSDVVGQSGQVVTFGACTKGTYTLEYSAESIQIFYEPDVTLKVEFLNDDGEPEDFSDKEIPPGEYTFNAKLVDRVTGEDVSGHELLGGNIDIDAKVKYNGEKNIELKPGDKVELKPGKDVDFEITATYLERYKITDKDCPDIPDLTGIEIKEPIPKLTVKADVKQTSGWYNLKKHNSWEPIRFDIKMDGKPLSDDQLENAQIDISFDGADKNIVYHKEILPGESAVNVYIGTDDTGKYTAPKSGAYTIKASVKAFDKYGVEANGQTQADFEVRNYGFGLKILGIIFIILAAIALIIFLLSIPAMPREIIVKTSADNIVPNAPDITTTKKIKFKAKEKQKTYSVKGVNGRCATNVVYKIKISRPDNKYFWGLKNCSWVNSRGIYIGSICLKRAKPVLVKFTVDSIGVAPGVIIPDSTLSEGDNITTTLTSYNWTEIVENDGVQRHLKANIDFSVNPNH